MDSSVNIYRFLYIIFHILIRHYQITFYLNFDGFYF